MTSSNQEMKPIFETDRLRIRNWDTDTDVEAAFAMYGDPDVMKYLGAAPVVVPSVEEMGIRLRKRPKLEEDGTGFFAIERKEDGHVVGSFIVKWLPDHEGHPTGDLEIGWHLAKSFWGNGYATEAAQAGIVYVIGTIPVDFIHAIAFKENVRSVAVMARLGMAYVGETSKYYGVTASLYRLEKHRLCQ